MKKAILPIWIMAALLIASSPAEAKIFKKKAKKAQKIIEDITREIEVGEIYEGTVTKIMPFGAFMDLGGGKEGLLHISKISDKRVEKVEDVLKEGDTFLVKVIDIDKIIFNAPSTRGLYLSL